MEIDMLINQLQQGTIHNENRIITVALNINIKMPALTRNMQLYITSNALFLLTTYISTSTSMYSTSTNNTNMEEAQYYWMWARKKQPIDHQLDLFNSTPIALRLTPMSSAMIDSRSWEEKAFAEDSAGILGGGCIWPPRSYPCSFCGRDFRSAQALGGHMNVHRRDRARLKQSSIVEEEDEAEDPVNPSLIPNFGNFEAAPKFGEEMRLGEMDFISICCNDIKI
ncbi:hypothetical protein M5K25_003255 [Dendrobium thyrsiflorum]|uniref:C2H2-type domain-containing protein n=1 Tax=Dendrobium thyrsiflorum TaxID=117978 RepID=A0ABD0VPM8_DENTH